jgi:F0F1-type ATP synthase beta subunit
VTFVIGIFGLVRRGKTSVVGGAGLAEGVPLLEAIGGHLSTIKSIIDTAAKIGVAGMSYREARELYKEFVSKK